MPADNFFKYDANGNSLTTISGSGGYTSSVATLTVTDYGYWGWIGNYGWNLYSVTIPEGADAEFVYNGNRTPLHSGVNSFKVEL